jgi:HAD superfamily hydrolase (TIGR01509 family)
VITISRNTEVVVAAVVFDLDGVLIDSEPIWEQVRRHYVDAHGGRWQPDSQSRLMGMSTAEWARYLSVELGVRRTPDEVAQEVVAQMALRYDEHVPLIPGGDEVVRRLAGQWPMGLASSSPARLIAAALQAAGLADVFAVALSTEQMSRGKPAPDVYLAAAEGLGVPATDCVAIEDSSNGVRSAAAAGMRVIGIPHDSYGLAPDAKAACAVVLGGLDGLTPQLVQSLGGQL